MRSIVSRDDEDAGESESNGVSPGHVGFERSFLIASRAKRQEADLFLADLLGGGRAPVLAQRRRSPVALAEDDREDDRDDDLAETTFTPEDLSADLKGLELELAIEADLKTSSGGTVRLPARTVVTVVTWDNDKPEVDVKAGGVDLKVAKEHLAPKVTAYTAKVTTAKAQRDVAIPLYTANVSSFRAAVTKGKAAGADQTRNYHQLNKHLILELMLNRLDSFIGTWTSYYNVTIGEPAGWVPLAPGWVKSMMVHESTAGTAGVYLVEVPGVPMKTRFNVLQAIDSWGPQQFLMMEELGPGLLKLKGLHKVMDDQRALEKEWELLDAKTKRSTAQDERLKYLDELKYARPADRRSPTWSPFFRRYPDVDMKPKAPKAAGGAATTTDPSTNTGSGGVTAASPTKYWDAVVAFLESGTPKKKYDYSFWIRTGVRWLFEKRKDVSTWSDAVRAYNGQGGRAELYRAIVLTRARAAAAAAGITEEIWGGMACQSGTKTADATFDLCKFERVANPCEPRC